MISDDTQLDISDLHDNNSILVCAICTEEIHHDYWCTKCCDNYFHSECIHQLKQFDRRNNKKPTTCPLCRESYTPSIASSTTSELGTDDSALSDHTIPVSSTYTRLKQILYCYSSLSFVFIFSYIFSKSLVHHHNYAQATQI